MDYFNKLDTVLSTKTANTKLFWKTAKQILELAKSSSDIPTLVMNNEHAEGDLQKAKMLNNFFTSQTIVDDSSKTLPDMTQPEYALNSVAISIPDVKDVLMHLNIYKTLEKGSRKRA